MRISDWSSDVCSSDLKDAIVNETPADAERRAASTSEHPLLIDGRWVAGEGERLTVLDKYHLTPFATVTSASPRQVTQMVEAAHGAYRGGAPLPYRSEEHTSELQSLMRISYAVFCLKKKKR